jgi:hypothetical protein
VSITTLKLAVEAGCGKVKSTDVENSRLRRNI